MIHKLIYPKFNHEFLHHDIVEINISELEKPLNLSDLKSENIVIGSDDDTKYVRIGSVRFGFGDGETYHYLIDNSFNIPFFKEGFDEERERIKNDGYWSTEDKKDFYLHNLLISLEIYCDEENKKVMKEIEADMEEAMFPVSHNGKSYTKEECDEMFLAYYSCREELNCEGGVYFTEGLWVYPDGSTEEF